MLKNGALQLSLAQYVILYGLASIHYMATFTKVYTLVPRKKMSSCGRPVSHQQQPPAATDLQKTATSEGKIRADSKQGPAVYRVIYCRHELVG
jgi:hypothetical protein